MAIVRMANPAVLPAIFNDAFLDLWEALFRVNQV